MAQPYPIPRELRQTSILQGDGVSATYGPFAFKVFDTEDITVYTRVSASGTFAPVAVTVTKVAGLAQDFFTVTFAGVVPTTTSYVVVGARLPERTAGITRGSRIDAAALEKELSKQAVTLQELRRDSGRAIKAEFGQSAPSLRVPADGAVLVYRNGVIEGGPDVDEVANAQAYAEEAKAARDEAVATVAAKQDQVFKVWAEAISRNMTDRFTDRISTAEFLGLETDDLGTAVNSALARARPGSLIFTPPSMSGANLVQAVEIRQNKPTFLDFGNVAVNVAGAITRLTVEAAAPYGRSTGGRWFGTRAPGSVFTSLEGFRSKVSDAQAELFDFGVRAIANPYSPGIDNIQMRNMRTGAVDLDDCVGAIVNGVRHDVDGAWYGGPYAAPNFGIRVACEGNIVTGCDMIHSGKGLFMEAVHRDVYWNFFHSSYLSDSSAGDVGVDVLNNSIYRMNGNFFSQCWSATNLVGVRFRGTGVIDGWYWIGGGIHNNLSEGVRAEIVNGRNIGFYGAQIAGNSQSGDGIANMIYSRMAGRLAVKSCELGRAMGWLPKVYSYLYQDAGGGEIDLGGSYLDPGGFTEALPIKKFGSGPILLDGVTGIKRKARGAANWTPGFAFKPVAHGLAFPVARENITVTPPFAMGDASRWGVDNIETPTAGEFQIKCDVDPGSAIQFGWMAEIDRL